MFVDVPQSYAPVIRVDQPADLLVDEFPGRVFPARVTSATGAVDPTSRTMLTVLQVDNSNGTLLPGMYAKARFHLPHTVNVLRLPAEALLFRTEGTLTPWSARIIRCTCTSSLSAATMAQRWR